MAEKYPTQDQDTFSSQNDLKLCPLDQQNPGLCPPLSCYNFHMCREYLLNNRCSEFELNGKCSHSHSLFTRHNQRILDRKLKLSAEDNDTFNKISELIKNSSRVERSSISDDDDHSIQFRNNQTNFTSNGRGRSRPLSFQPAPVPSLSRKISSHDQSSTNEKRFSISTRIPPSSPTRRLMTRSIDLSADQLDREENNKGLLTTVHSSIIYKHEDKNDHSSSRDDIDENNGTSSIAATLASSVLGLFSRFKDKNPAKPDPNDSVRSDTQLKYVFDKYSQADQLSYLLGPIRNHLVKHNIYQIFPSGYCRLANKNEEKEIEHKLTVLLPITLITDSIQLANDHLAFLISTSAAERIFEQNQISYSIISTPYTATLNIEVIHGTKVNRNRSRSLPPGKILSTRSSIEHEKSHLPLSDGKFRISSTNSSIDVIYGDLTQTKVDLMVCVTTSVTLLSSVLSKAGQSVASEYRQHAHSRDSVLLDGGYTLARKILFVPWKLEIESSNTMKAQQSLSDLVKRCINEAHQLKMTSISFPPIGTGKIGFDPNKVCESMINAASECLHKYKMDVLFVIYPSTGNDNNQQSYQIFRTYLDNLCKQNRSRRAESPSGTHVSQAFSIPIERIEQVRRTAECRRISTVSDSLNMTPDHIPLVRLLERLIEEKTFDLSLVQKPLIDRVKLLIEICLDYHVIPRIDFTKDELILRGDRDSCLQCFANLRNQRLIHKYNIIEKTRKSVEIELNMYISMKIDEAFTNNESNIRIENDDKTVFDIDLKSLEVHTDGSRQVFHLYKQQLNDSKISFPNSWSPLHLIRTIEVSHSSLYSMDCVYNFEDTMPKTEWHILRVDAIENWPLYVHYTRKKNKDEILAFHGCSFSSVQSIIHYGLHSNYSEQTENSIHLTRDALSSHIRNTRRSTDGKYYMFAVRLSKKIFNQDYINLSNDDTHLALPTYLIVYQRQTVL